MEDLSVRRLESEEPDKRQRQLDAIDRLAAIEPLPVPESLSERNRAYSRLKVGNVAGCLPLDDDRRWTTEADPPFVDQRVEPNDAASRSGLTPARIYT
jgi:hypothetical protein